MDNESPTPPVPELRNTQSSLSRLDPPTEIDRKHDHQYVGLIIPELAQTLRGIDGNVHGWVRTLLAVEAGAVVAVGFVLNGSLVDMERILAMSGISVLGILGAYLCCSSAISELRWQGKMIRYWKRMDDIVYHDIDPDPDGRGVQATGLYHVRWVLIILWLVAPLFFTLFTQ